MQFTKTKLSLAMLVALTPLTYAEDSVNLSLINVVTENSGAKAKTNAVTLKDLNKSASSDLRSLLKEEPSINFGGGNGGTSQ